MVKVSLGQLHKQGKVKPPHADHSASGKAQMSKFLITCKERALHITPNEILEKESFLSANYLSNFFFLNIFPSRWVLVEKENHQG